MNFGVPKEIRHLEHRVGLTPSSVDALVRAGHQVLIECDAGVKAGFSDRDYEAVGGQVVYGAGEAYGRADVVVKVTRPRACEHTLFRPGQVITAFLHMAVASPDLLQAFRQKEITAIAYETIEEDDGNLPVLRPTSEVAGRMAPIIAGQLLESMGGGRGILLGGIPGVPSAEVVILGAGVLGASAARAFLGVGAQVTILDKDPRALEQVEKVPEGRVATLWANPYNIAKVVAFADVLVGAVTVAGQRAPVLVTRSMVRLMRSRAVIIDFAIDMGGCVETSHPTTHADPAYIDEDVIHYCVPNAPARVARTASYALSNVILPYLLEIGELGVEGASKVQTPLQRGVNVSKGQLVHPALVSEVSYPVAVAVGARIGNG